MPLFNTSVIESFGISVDTNCGNITFIVAYFPGTSLTPATFVKFREDIGKLINHRGSFIVGGDFNSKHRFWNCSNANRAGNILYQEMNSKNFVVHYPDEPTHYPTQRRFIPSTIDLVLSNNIH